MANLSTLAVVGIATTILAPVVSAQQSSGPSLGGPTVAEYQIVHRRYSRLSRVISGSAPGPGCVKTPINRVDDLFSATTTQLSGRYCLELPTDEAKGIAQKSWVTTLNNRK